MGHDGPVTRLRTGTLLAGLVLVLAGCTSTVEGTASPGAAAVVTPGDDPLFEAPAIGTCHDLEVAYLPLEPPAVVDCDEDHTSETAVVVDTGLPLDAAYPTVDDLDDDYLGAAYDDVCRYDTPQEYLGDESLYQLYASYAQVLPTQEQWAAGARWVACDVYYGYSSPEVAPGRMAGALAGPDRDAYLYCLSGDVVSQETVPCTEPHFAEPSGGTADVAEGSPYPTDQAARAVYAQSCQSSAVQYLGGQVPAGVLVDITTDDQEGWEGYPYAECILVPADGSETTGSLLP